MRKLSFSIATALLMQGATAIAETVPLSAAYLQGIWILDGKEGCKSDAARYVLFRDNGTLEAGRGGLATRVGFWKIVNENTIVGHTLSAPSQHEEYHPFFRDNYRYEYMSPQVVKAEQDTFTVTVGSDLGKESYALIRCK
jgi:hypothetical protein